MMPHLQNVLRMNLTTNESRVLVAVSGGLDSMVLLHLLEQTNYTIFVAHCNFKLRGFESDADQEFVIQYCQQRGIPCFVKSFQTETYAAENQLSIQEAARILRYTWFEKLRSELMAEAILLGHHADDSMETFFINFLRGSGIRGLKGIMLKNQYLLRPLLAFTRNSLEEYAANHSVFYREDRSNASDSYLRNRIRHQLLPKMRELRPNASESMHRSLNHLSKAAAIHEDFIESHLSQLIRADEDGETIFRQDLMKEKYAEHLLTEYLLRRQLSVSATTQLLDHFLAGSYGQEFESGSGWFYLEKEFLRFEIIKNKDFQNEYLWSEDKFMIPRPIRIKKERLPFHSLENLSFKAPVAYVDAAKLKFPLKIRHWREGDRFFPFGMNHSKLISDFFIDQKVPKYKKKKIWLLLSGEDIVWVIGYRIDNRFRIDDSTKEFVKFTCL